LPIIFNLLFGEFHLTPGRLSRTAGFTWRATGNKKGQKVLLPDVRALLLIEAGHEENGRETKKAKKGQKGKKAPFCPFGPFLPFLFPFAIHVKPPIFEKFLTSAFLPFCFPAVFLMATLDKSFLPCCFIKGSSAERESRSARVSAS
jgi:hypothetical protein